MFQTPQMREGSGIMAGVAPIRGYAEGDVVEDYDPSIMDYITGAIPAIVGEDDTMSDFFSLKESPEGSGLNLRDITNFLVVDPSDPVDVAIAGTTGALMLGGITAPGALATYLGRLGYKGKKATDAIEKAVKLAGGRTPGKSKLRTASNIYGKGVAAREVAALPETVSDVVSAFSNDDDVNTGQGIQAFARGGMSTEDRDDLRRAVMEIESGGDPDAISPKGARGQMQVMPNTLRDPGFGVTPARDSSGAENVRIGNEYLDAMLDRYGNTEHALIAYNWGPGNTDDWLARGANSDELPNETRNYIPKVFDAMERLEPLQEQILTFEKLQDYGIESQEDFEKLEEDQRKDIVKSINLDRGFWGGISGIEEKVRGAQAAVLDPIVGAGRGLGDFLFENPLAYSLGFDPEPKGKRTTFAEDFKKQFEDQGQRYGDVDLEDVRKTLRKEPPDPPTPNGETTNNVITEINPTDYIVDPDQKRGQYRDPGGDPGGDAGEDTGAGAILTRLVNKFFSTEGMNELAYNLAAEPTDPSYASAQAILDAQAKTDLQKRIEYLTGPGGMSREEALEYIKPGGGSQGRADKIWQVITSSREYWTPDGGLTEAGKIVLDGFFINDPNNILKKQMKDRLQGEITPVVDPNAEAHATTSLQS